LEQYVHVQAVTTILLQQLLQLHHASKNCANLSFAPCLSNNEPISINIGQKLMSSSVFQLTRAWSRL